MNSRLTESPESMVDPQAIRSALQPSMQRPVQRKINGAAPSPLFRGSDRTNVLTGFSIRALGGYVPDRCVTNAELESEYGFEPGWVERRTGILERRIVADDEATSDMAVRAAQVAIKKAGVDPSQIDLVVVGTFSPDYLCPSTACIVQDKLGLDAPAMDVQAACSGFMYALVTAAQFVATGNAKLALVIGADANSRIVPPSDQRITPLFGDGAGAVLLEAAGPENGLIRYQLGSDGSGRELLDRPGGGSAMPLSPQQLSAGDQFLRMDGRNVFKWAIQAVTESIRTVLDASAMTVDEIDMFILHQANIRIIDHAVKDLGIPEERVFNNLSRVGNTSAASIPLAMEEAAQAGRVHPGDRVMMCGFGAGLTWGTGIFQW